MMDITNYCQMKKIIPTGLTMDCDENLFVSLCGGGKILKLNLK